MSKNRLLSTFSAVKKLNSVRLDPLPSLAGTKLSCNLQSQNVREQIPSALVLQEFPPAAGYKAYRGFCARQLRLGDFADILAERKSLAPRRKIF